MVDEKVDGMVVVLVDKKAAPTVVYLAVEKDECLVVAKVESRAVNLAVLTVVP